MSTQLDLYTSYFSYIQKSKILRLDREQNIDLKAWPVSRQCLSTKPRILLFYHSKNYAGGINPSGIYDPYIYQTQKMLSVYLAPWGVRRETGFYAGCQIFMVVLISFLYITQFLIEVEE